MSEISDFDSFVKERKEKLNAPKQDYKLDYIPAEVVAYKNELNEQVAEVEHDTNYAALAGSIGVELGAGIYASHKLKTGKRYMNSLRNAKYAMNIFRGIQAANTATVGKSITPWGAAVQIGGYGLAEAGIWATSNYFGQQIRTAYGLQDDQNISETMSAALFGVVAAPVEKVFEAGKLAQKAFKLSDGLVDLKAWKGREFMVNGTNKFISGAVLGLTESAFRQEIAIMLNEQENRDIYDYMLSGGIGGSLNSVIGMWAKTGAWGRQQEATMYARTKKSVQEQIDEIDAQLTETATGTTDRRALASKKRTLRLKRKELEEVLEITDEMETKTTQSSEFAAQQEVTHQGEPKQAPKLSLDENVTVAKEAPATPKETPGATPAPDLPETRVTGEDGKPLIVYRGLRNEEGLSEGLGGRPASFTESEDIATIYSSKPNPDPFSLKDAEFTPTSNVNAVYLNIKKPLDFTNSGAEMDLGEYLDILGYGEKGGITDDEIVELLRYIQRRGRGKDAAKDNFKFELSELVQPKEGKPLDFSTDEFTGIDNLIDEIATESRVDFTAASDEIREALLIDTFILADAPITKTVGQRLGNDGITHIDAFGGSGEAPNLLGKKADDVRGLAEESSRYTPEQGSFPERINETHVTHRPFSEDQVIPVSKTAKGKPAPAPKETPDISNVPTEGITSAQVDDILNDFETVYQKAVADGEESIIAETLIDKTRRIYDNADFDMENIIDSIGKNPESITPDTLRNLIDKVDVQIKLLNGIYGRLNALGGRVVRMNRQDVSPTANSTFSQATELTSEALYQVKKRAEGMLGISGDDFIAEAQKFISKVDDTPPVTVKDDVVPTPKDATEAPAKTEGIDSKETTDSVATVKTSLDKRIEKLQAQLESFYPNLGGKKLTAKQKSQKKKIDEDPEVKALKASIARSKKYQREADKIVELEKEAARLAKVAERDVPTEMADEVAGKKKPKAPALNPELDALKNQITAAKKLFRQRLKKIVDDENKLLQQQQNAELFEEIYSYVTREAEMEALRPFFKGLRTVRMLRKLSMVNSLTSAQAAIPTGAFELFKLLPRAAVSKASAVGKDDVTQRLALADVEAFFEGFKFLTDKKTFDDLFHHMRRTFKEGRDPNYNSATRFNDETLVTKNILPTGSAKIMRDAATKAREAAIGQEATLRWARERLKLGKFMDFMSLGARAIMATDAGFKRQLRFANARAEATKKAILADPSNPNFKQEADRILDSWTKDKGGLGILGDIEELADGNRYIDEALLMTSRTDNVQDVARNFTEEILIRPITKLLNDDSTKKGALLGTAIEALMPFYSVGVRSVSKMAGLANPLRGLSKFTNPYDDIIRDLESKKGQFKILVKNRTRRGQTKEAARAATQVRQLDERIRMAEGRRVNYNKEVLTDMLIQLSFGTAAFTAGYLGYATGTNSWMTADQKRKNPNKGAYQMFGIDYRAAVPVNLLMAMAADMGNYMRASQDGQLSKKMGNVQVMLNAVSNSMVDLPLAQGVKDIQSVFSENYDFEASVSEIVSSYVPVPSQAKKFVRKITSGEDLVDLRGGSFSDRMIYHVFGAAPPNRQVDILGQFKESTKTWGHTINRFASSKEIEYQPYQERIASDHDGALAGRLPAGFDAIPRGQDMTNFVDEDGRTLHQHFALRLQETDIVERVNEFVTSSDFYDIYGLTVDDGEIRKNMGLKAMQSMLNGYYRQVKAEMQSDPSFLSRFVNDNDENLLELIENNKALQEIEYPKPL